LQESTLVLFLKGVCLYLEAAPDIFRNIFSSKYMATTAAMSAMSHLRANRRTRTLLK